MVTKKFLLSLAVILLSSLTCVVTFVQGGQSNTVNPPGSVGLTDQMIREQGLSSVDASSQGRRSMFIWDDYFFTGDAFSALSEVLTAYQIDRVYHAIPSAYFERQELLDMVHKMTRQGGVQVVALNGDSSWLEDGLDEYKSWIDSLHQYNQNHTHHQISAVALDVEGHALDSFRRNPAAGFADYCECMEEAYQYAHDRDLEVIQIIPTSLDTIDQEQFEWFLKHCCDEISIMNYRKSTALSAIWNEVLTCRRLGVPVETIYETMPINSKQGVTEEITYFYEGPEALASAVEEMQGVYGSSLSIGYHHFETMYHMHTNLYLARIYPYAKSKSDGDENGQMEVGEQIKLRSSKGKIVPAWLSPPNLETDAAEYSYLAVGVLPDMNYYILLDSGDYRVTTTRPLRFKEKDGKMVYSVSFHAEPVE